MTAYTIQFELFARCLSVAALTMLLQVGPTTASESRMTAIDPNAITECDRLASDPFDKMRVTPGSEINGAERKDVIEICRDEFERQPENLRIQHQLASVLIIDDNPNGISLLKSAAEAGYIAAQRMLGYAHQVGRGVGVDKRKAFKWFKRAARNGDHNAQYWHGMFVIRGTGTVADPVRGRDLLIAYGEAGNGQAFGALGELYGQGKHLPLDVKKSVKFSRLGVDAGDPVSMSLLGARLVTGEGVKLDIERGHRLLTEAARSGAAEAEYILGLYYLQGTGIRKDFERGRYWVCRSAAYYVALVEFSMDFELDCDENESQ